MRPALLLVAGLACVDLSPPSVATDGGATSRDQAIAVDQRAPVPLIDAPVTERPSPDADRAETTGVDLLPDSPAPLAADAAVEAPVAAEAAAPPQLAPPPDAAADQAPSEVPVMAPCPPGSCRRVFLTSTPVAVAGAGGVTTADGVCQSLAVGRGLGGSWRAWLSDGSSSPRSRFSAATVPYRLLDGSLVASDFTDLTDGTIARPIDVYETGAAVPAGVVHEVWTGTLASGLASGATCLSWQHRSGVAPYGLVGYSNDATARWTNRFNQFCDRTDVHLYCFEQ